MGKNIRRGRTGNVRCASCGQLTRRDRAVYLFKNGIKAYYCPDCAKKVHGSRLYKGMPKFVRKRSSPKVKRKFAIYSTEEEQPGDEISQSITEEQPENEPTSTEAQPETKEEANEEEEHGEEQGIEQVEEEPQENDANDAEEESPEDPQQ